MIRKFDELQEAIARIAYYNPGFDVFLRGQSSDYTTQMLGGQRTTILPSLFRSPTGQGIAGKGVIAARMAVLDHYKAQVRLAPHFSGVNALKQHEVAVWALLQHYQVTPTPLVDVTRSARVAASFALAGPKPTSRYIYAFGLPYVRDNISVHYAEELITLNLRSLMPPQATRPHFQEGYLVGTIPGMGFRSPPSDLARRLIAKFEIPVSAHSGFFPRGNRPVASSYLLPRTDPIRRWLRKLPKP